MLEEDHSLEDDGSEELLRRALLDDSAAVAVSLRVDGLPVSEAVTVIFHGRRDLGLLQTYVTWGSRTAGARVAAADLLRVPCDLDLADAEDREEDDDVEAGDDIEEERRHAGHHNVSTPGEPGGRSRLSRSNEPFTPRHTPVIHGHYGAISRHRRQS